MTPAQVIKHYQSQVAAAAAIGIRQSAVANMVRRGQVSALSQLKWEAATAGALRADPKILKSSKSRR